MRALVCSLLALAVFVSGLVALPALAQSEPDPAAERAESFEAATGAQTENVPGGLLMVTAYGAVFLLLLGACSKAPAGKAAAGKATAKKATARKATAKKATAKTAAAPIDHM